MSAGVYVDERDNVPLDILERYLGVYGDQTRQHTGQTGTSTSVDEWNTMVTQISADQQGNIRHDGITPPPTNHPFPNPTIEEIFRKALQNVESEGLLPNNYRIRDDEWNNEEYPSKEVIQFGRGSRKCLKVKLPVNIWKPRAERWCQAHSIMVSLQTRIDT